MRCPVHKNENKEFKSVRDLKIHLEKSSIDECPVCGNEIPSRDFGSFKKHLLHSNKNRKDHEELLQELKKIYGNHGRFKKTNKVKKI